MRGIAKLLFGDGLIQPNDDDGARGDGTARGNSTAHGDSAAHRDGPFAPGDGWELAERARRAGEWCGSTPGRGAVARALGDLGRPR